MSKSGVDASSRPAIKLEGSHHPSLTLSGTIDLKIKPETKKPYDPIVVYDDTHDLTTIEAKGILSPLEHYNTSSVADAYVWLLDAIYDPLNNINDTELPPQGGSVTFNPDNAITLDDETIAELNAILGGSSVKPVSVGKNYRVFYNGQEIDFSAPDPFALLFPANYGQEVMTYEVEILALDDKFGIYITSKKVQVTVIKQEITTPSNIRRQLTIPRVTGIVTDPPAGRHYVPSTYSFIISAQEGYNIDSLDVSTGTAHDEDIYLESIAEGVVKVTIYGLNEPLSLTISGVVPVQEEQEEQEEQEGLEEYSSSTANELFAPQDVAKVWAYGGYLYIHTPKAETVSIYTFSGQLREQIPVTEGDHSFPLPKGRYVVVMGKFAGKVIL
ncbi:MAG: hypothetical protein LBT83_12560 [Tannerella sp.]|nr:hypothetical protein [Tannerella sp.]